MKKTLLALMLTSTVFSAFAADTVDLKVKGVLTNSACTPTLSNNSVVDFGHVLISSLNKATPTTIGSKNFSFTITCDSATAVGFVTADNRTDSSSSSAVSSFGLGKTSESVNIGYYTIAFAGNSMADGVIQPIISSSNNGSTWGQATGVTYLYNTSAGKEYSFSDASFTPLAYKVGVFNLTLSAEVQAANTLNITDDTNLDGLATFSLVYI